jgi:uncharacterized phage protein gp47/JayE
MVETGFARPTLPALIEEVRADLLARLSQDEVLRRSDLEVQARVQAAALHSVYGYISWLARQILPDTADSDWLDRHASWWGVSRKPAAKATGTVTVTTTAGATIPAGSVLQRAGIGDYVTTEEVTAVGTSTTLSVEAATAGAAGNLPAGARLTLISPIAGVQSTAVVVEISSGADVEGDDELRDRIRDRIRQPPHGGARHDYETWALEVAGVTRAWVYPSHLGLGTVGVTFVLDGRDDIIPTAGEVAAVQAYIDERRPVTADVTVIAPVADPLNLSIRLNPDSTAIRAAVEAELRDFLGREAEPGGTIYLSRLREAISIATGEYRHDLVSPVADVVAATGHIAVLGTITWVP